MKLQLKVFLLAVCVAALSATSLFANPINRKEVEEQNNIYERWWGTKLEWKFDALPEKGMVEKYRMPYAGHIYPDTAGGTANVLRKYDAAFHGGRRLATSYEFRDIEATKERKGRGGPFGLMLFNRARTPDWAGHCNGWTAAAIRHAEPTENVTQNGVTFTPSDIKGLMAELYTYTDIEFLGGVDAAINPATFHVVISNWLGRNKYPIGFDSTVGKEVWNFPMYGYSSSSAKRRGNQVEVKVNMGYVHYTNGEYEQAPTNAEFMYFHYILTLNSRGEITGGRYYRDSEQLDMMWLPLKPTPGGQEGNLSGNPYLDVDTVLGLWRASAPKDLRQKWYTIDAAQQDQVGMPIYHSEGADQPVVDAADEDSDESESTPADDQTVAESSEQQPSFVVEAVEVDATNVAEAADGIILE